MKLVNRLINDSQTTKFSKLNLMAILSLLLSAILVPATYLIGLFLSTTGRSINLFAWNTVNLSAVVVSSFFLAISLTTSIYGIKHKLGNRVVYALSMIAGVVVIFCLIGVLLFIIYYYTLLPGMPK